MRMSVVHVHPDHIEISHRNSESREVIVEYIRKNSTLVTREENGKVLEARIFGDECSRVRDDWLRNPMPEHRKAEALERYEGIILPRGNL